MAGGGTAYISAIPEVEALVNSLEGDEKPAQQLFLKPEEPLRQIAANAGVDGSVVVDRVKKSEKVWVLMPQKRDLSTCLMREL